MENLIQYLKTRGIINKISDEQKLQEAINKKQGIYIGFDPSFKSLHLGNYIQIHLLNIFAKYGLPTYAVIGGATGAIGDPSGKKQERQLLDLKQLNINIECLTNQIRKLTNIKEIINNATFYKNMTIFGFLRNAGKLINVNYLLEKDIIARRLESGISYAEFSYNIIQGYDFLWLYQHKGIAIQCGGSDQWGNITTGLEMIRKTHEHANAVGITINLLTKADGTKFGKSEKGAIYLDSDITSPYEMYQFILNQADENLLNMYYFFSDLNIEEINTLLARHKQNPSLRLGQKTLAKEIIEHIHGHEAYNQCFKISNALFNNKLNELNLSELDVCLQQYNPIVVSSPIKLVDFLLNNNTGITSKRILRDLIKAQTLLVNNKIINDENVVLNDHDAYLHKYTIIKKGKKNYFIIKWTNK